MLKILTSAKTKDLDAYTIKHEPISSIALMERACQAFITWFTQNVDAPKKIGVICGTGNNGGDGLAIARLLSELNYTVIVWIVRGEAPVSVDFKINLERINEKVEVIDIKTTSDPKLFSECDVLIDAIFGSGLSRPVTGIYEQVINCINISKAIKISVDVPSGLFTDHHTVGNSIKADHTISFQLPKLAFLMPENYKYVGDWKVVDIGLSNTFFKEAISPYFYITNNSVKEKLKKRTKFDHKGTFGHALLIAGSFGKMGACILSAKACLRAGVGLLTVHVPKSGYTIIQTSVPEAMASVDEHELFFSNVNEVNQYSSIGIGPGLGQSKETVDAFHKILKHGRPLIIDADGLNIIALNSEFVELIPKGSILTPHPKEFERLVGKWQNDFERLDMQIRFSIKTKCVVILKGAHSSIATPDGEVYFNSTGNPGMATGGSGDVLTGILTGLLAQGYCAKDAAIVGVYVHGLAGDLAAVEKSQNSLIASDLIDFLPAAFKAVAD